MQEDINKNQLENIEIVKASNSEEYDNLIGLFSVLLRVDKRVNPHNYRVKQAKS